MLRLARATPSSGSAGSRSGRICGAAHQRRPRSQARALTNVHLGEIRTDDVSFLGAFTNATSLTLMCRVYSQIDVASCLHAIGAMPQLQHLIFHHSELTEEAFVKLIGSLPALKSCDIGSGTFMHEPPPESVTRHLAFSFLA